MPPQCKAVAELEVELMTGRAHQIRGQLSAMGFPVCGDAVYGGVAHYNGDTSPPPIHSESPRTQEQRASRYTNSDKLALQCCKFKRLVSSLRNIIRLLVLSIAYSHIHLTYHQ